MIRNMTLLTATLLLSVSCSGGSEPETAQVPTSAATATIAQNTPTPAPIPTATPVPVPTTVIPTETASLTTTVIPSAPTPTQVPPAQTTTSAPTPTQVPSTPTRLRSEGRGLINLKEGIVSGDVLLDFGKECSVTGFPWTVGQLDNDQVRIKLTKDLASDFTLSEASAPSELGISNFWVKARPDEVQRWETRQEGSWFHEFERTSLSTSEKNLVYKLPTSETGFRIDLKIELEMVSKDGQECSVVAYEKVSRSDALYPTTLPNLPTETQQPNLTKYETFLAEKLPEPDVQALMLAASWWEDRGPGSANTLPGETGPRPDGKLGEYVDVFVHKPVTQGTPLKVGIYGLPNDEIMRDFRDAFEILAVIAPNLKAGFASTPDEVTLWVHYVDDCQDDSVLGKDLYADSRCGGLGYYDGGSDPTKAWHGKGFGAIQIRASDWQKLELAIVESPDTHDGRWGFLEARASVFHELGHALGLEHNRCAKSQMRAPNGTKQPLGWSAEDLKQLAAIHDSRIPQGYFTNNDYDILKGWEPDGTRHSYGATLATIRSVFEGIDEVEWDRMLNDRQAMCESDLTDTYWDRLQEAYETQYKSTPRFANYFEKKEDWPNYPDCYEFEIEAANNPRACGD